MKISVVIAAWKGEKYIKEQIMSILPQLGKDDEIIVSDDYPQGLTKAEVLSVNDERIKYIESEGKGVVKNFENALRATTGDIIFLCDQDDVWMPGKVETVMKCFEEGSDLILHNAKITGASLEDTGETSFGKYNPDTKLLNNIISNTYVGCCMAFRREILGKALPFPENLPMHDWWIALVAIKKGFKVTLIDTPLILWRRHGDNVTGNKTSASEKIKWRLSIIKNLITV